MGEALAKPVPKLLVTIVDRDQSRKVTEVLQAQKVHFHFAFLGMGTASSELMDVLGLGCVEKSVILCVAPQSRIPVLMGEIKKALKLEKQGRGIAFSTPLSGVSTPINRILTEEAKQCWQAVIEREEARMSSEAKHDLIIAVVNQGSSDDLMDAANAAGARGGTVVHARRIGAEAAVKFFGISVQAEKDLVAIITTREQKKAIMQAISQTCGIATEHKGLVFSVPVDSVEGLA